MRGCYKVIFVSVIDCFFYLNKKNLSKYIECGELEDHCIEIKYGEEFRQWTYSSLSRLPFDIADDQIGLNHKYSELLNIKENDEVVITLQNVSCISKAEIQPLAYLHYELIKENQCYLEISLQDKVRVVTKGCKMPIRLFGNVDVVLKIVKLYPDHHFGQLQKHTELEITSPLDMAETDTKIKSIDDSNALNLIEIVKTPFKMLISLFLGKQNDSNMSFNENSDGSHITGQSYRDERVKSISQGSKKNKFFSFRIAPLFHAPKDIQQLIGPNCAFASTPIQVTWELSKNASECIKILCKIILNDQAIKEEDLVHNDDNLTYSICFTTKLHHSRDILYLPNNIMKDWNVELGSKVWIKPERSIEENDDVIREEIILENPSEASSFPSSIKEIFDNVFQIIIDNIRFNQKINSLIIGARGSGKTYLVDQLCHYLVKNNLFVEKISCRTLRKLKVSNLEKNLIQKLSECSNKPSVMILDDLDALIVDDGEGNPYSSMYTNRVGSLITSLIISLQRHREIFFIATGSDIKRFTDMSTDRGPIAFDTIHEIIELTPNDREFLLKYVINKLNLNNCVDECLIEYIVKETKGYNVQDLTDLIELAQFKAFTRTDSKRDKIIREDFDIALNEKVPLFLYDVHLQKKPTTKWEDIGGMEESKALLKEMFEWPVKYQEVYRSCPLRLQCGVLLYGAPGTGKTLIASAVANEFGLNFISIKGPEVFSKYVGGSEQGIRDLFSRAKSAKPCLLFFDEFESLARRRGNSNEDVNDRVVNQLLTELDGVEELTGVFILAASSRPDLIDPAVLRPGRIDKIVQCKLPTKSERLAILKILSKDMKLSNDVNLKEISTKTDGYSGADLRAILYAAQATLIKEIRRAQDKHSHPDIVLKQRHLLTGLSETKPSISKEERENYNFSYEAFHQSASGKSVEKKTPHYQQKVMFA